LLQRARWKDDGGRLGASGAQRPRQIRGAREPGIDEVNAWRAPSPLELLAKWAIGFSNAARFLPSLVETCQRPDTLRNARAVLPRIEWPADTRHGNAATGNVHSLRWRRRAWGLAAVEGRTAQGQTGTPPQRWSSVAASAPGRVKQPLLRTALEKMADHASPNKSPGPASCLAALILLFLFSLFSSPVKACLTPDSNTAS
jgi:hypothetical protein